MLKGTCHIHQNFSLRVLSMFPVSLASVNNKHSTSFNHRPLESCSETLGVSGSHNVYISPLSLSYECFWHLPLPKILSKHTNLYYIQYVTKLSILKDNIVFAQNVILFNIKYYPQILSRHTIFWTIIESKDNIENYFCTQVIFLHTILWTNIVSTHNIILYSLYRIL